MKLVVISSPKSLPGEGCAIQGMVQGGLRSFHLRKPDWADQQYAEFIEPLDTVCRRTLVLHRSHELVSTLTLKTLTQSPFLREAGQSCSASLHSIEELEADVVSQLDYAFLSPIFDSVSKPGHAAAFDLATLPEALRRARCPIYALGGITADNIPLAASLGFAGVAVLGSIWQNTDPVRKCMQLLEVSRNS